MRHIAVLLGVLFGYGQLCAQETKEILLRSIITTSEQDGVQHIGNVLKADNGYLRQLRQDTKGGASNVFLVEAEGINDAVKASFDVFLGSLRAATPATVSTTKQKRPIHWLAVYLGPGPSTPVWWTVEGATVQGNTVRLTYRQSRPQPATEDVHRYYCWVPLGKLAPGAYSVELFDADEKAVTLMRRVKVEANPK
jgi:hypothetical protein